MLIMYNSNPGNTNSIEHPHDYMCRPMQWRIQDLKKGGEEPRVLGSRFIWYIRTHLPGGILKDHLN